MKIKTYDDIKLEVLDKSRTPGKIAKVAVAMTMKKHVAMDKPLSAKTIKFLLSAEHTSVLEHNSMSIMVTGMSRSLLAQITRTRIGISFTSASQHYQDYRDYPTVVHPQFAKDTIMRQSLDNAFNNYTDMVDRGMPVYEARQCLPGAASNNMVITANAVTMARFFRSRMCNRNVDEMRNFVIKWYRLAKKWWPEFFKLVGPPCHMDGRCNQGFMMSPKCK